MAVVVAREATGEGIGMVSRDEAVRTYEQMAATLREHSEQDRAVLEHGAARNGERLAAMYDQQAERARQAGDH